MLITANNGGDKMNFHIPYTVNDKKFAWYTSIKVEKYVSIIIVLFKKNSTYLINKINNGTNFTKLLLLFIKNIFQLSIHIYK